MPKMNVERSIFIDAKPEAVYAILSDFNHWSIWSPWLVMEKGVKVEVNEDGKYYSWEGERIGAGNMKITSEKQNELLNMDLTFLKPWKSHAKITLQIAPKENGTTVSWIMNSSLPFFLFWMKKMMSAFIGMDFERGLKMLRDYSTEGKVYSALEIDGITSFDGCKYVGIKGECSIDAIGKDIEGKMEEIKSFLQASGVASAGEGLAIYHKWDLVGKSTAYTVGIPVNEFPKNCSGNMFTGELSKRNMHKVTHRGAYEHLGNAWTLQQMMARGKEFKMDKKVHPFEWYVNSPENVAKEDYVTEIYFGIK